MARIKQLRHQRLLFVLLTLLVVSTRIAAQNNNPYQPKIIPPSPNAASLGKFGDIPVSPYTGSTDISIPVYTIQAKGVSVPVSLSYHSGGIRLAEEAGWVGIGWALNAGGMISRSINDKDDLFGGYYYSDNPSNPVEIKGKFVSRVPYTGETYLGPWAYYFTCRYKTYTEVNTYDLYNQWNNISIAPTIYDVEPDSYSFNFLGRSGKFIIGRDRTIVLQKQENLKIQFATGDSTFTIIDEQGNKYYFAVKEYNKPTSGGATHISSWMLTKVVTQQKDSVMFSYTNDNSWSTVKGIAHESDRKGATGLEGTTYSNDAGQDYLNRTLQYIDYSNARVDFVFSGGRTDVLSGKKLNTIKIYSKDKVDSLKYLKEQQLFYSYFTPATGNDLEFQRLRLDSVKEVSGTSTMPPYAFYYTMPASMQNLMAKHYSSVDHWGYFNGKSNAVAGNNNLGFLAGYEGVLNLGPAGTPTVMSIPGANRDPDPTFMTAFSLNKVVYPTGGFTTMEYEPNYYDYNKSISGASVKEFEYLTTVVKTLQLNINTNGNSSGVVDLSNLLYAVPVGVGTNLGVTVAFRGNIDSLNKYHTQYPAGRISFTFQSNTIDAITSDLICGSGVCSKTSNYTISSRQPYSWSAFIDPMIKIPNGLTDIQVTFTWKEALFTNATMLMAAGLRIKSIIDYSATGKIAKKRIYDYNYQEDRDGDGVKESYSYGRQMGYVSYARYERLNAGGGTTTNSFTRYSGSNSSFSSQSSGNIVGYDQVTEYVVDPETNTDIGKTVYTYNNSSDTCFQYSSRKLPGIQNLPNNLNGLPKSKNIFARSGNGYKRVSSTDYYYRSANRIIYDAMKYETYTWLPPGTVGVLDCNGGQNPQACNCPVQKDSTGLALLACYYPAISSEVVLLDSTVEKTLDQNDTTLQLKVVTKNFYDNTKHYQITRTSVTDSKNNTQTSQIKYPQDYIPIGFTVVGNAILDSMINKNMLSTAIEKRDSFYLSGSPTGSVKGAQLSTFKLLSNQTIALDKQFNLDLQSPVTDFQAFAVSGASTSQDSRYRQMISFDSYDNDGNIQQYTTTDQLPMTVIWDYKNQYPVAQVKKGLLADVAYTSFEFDGKGSWTFTGTATADATSPTGGSCYNLAGGNITRSGLISSKVYAISYWRKTASALTIAGTQGTPLQGKTIDGWTYFEHKVTGQTSTTISGTSYIDELRLYPFNAEMTTYTYNPLVGMTSACDVNNKITYYFYDEFMRLKWIKDQDKNIIKTFRYHYINQGAPNN